TTESCKVILMKKISLIKSNKIIWLILLMNICMALDVTLAQPLNVNAEVEPYITDEMLEEDEDNKANYLARTLNTVLLWIGDGLIMIFGAQDISTLVFQHESLSNDDGLFSRTDFLASRDGLVLGLFPESLFRGVSYIYDFVESLTPIPVLIILTMLGVYLLMSGFSSEKRASAKNYILGLFLMLIVLRWGFLVWD